ncbi:MFS transporter [Klebsiella pneumoniae]|nr:MFS transporter [Klebsiella pneumoniae]
MAENTLSIREKIGYGMGDAGCTIIFGAIMLFVNYFYTDIFGLAPALVGVLLPSVRAYRCGNRTFIMGALADRTCSKYGRFRPWPPWIASSPTPRSASRCSPLLSGPYNSKVIYAFVTHFLLWSITYTAINILYRSLGTV